MVKASGASSILERIVSETRAALPHLKAATPEKNLREAIAAQPAPRDFVAALRRPGLGLVAEVKKGSPSRGPFPTTIDHVRIACLFRDAGAVAISVLTSPHFYGADSDLIEIAASLNTGERVAATTPLPLLRKEFHLDPYQVLEARALGADAYLLIVKTLELSLLRDLILVGQDLSMTAFVEVTDEMELETALTAGATAIGINNRDLRTFHEDLATTERLRPLIPSEISVVAASGVRDRAALTQMRAAHVDAVLIGEALNVNANPAAKIKELFSDGSDEGLT